MSELLKRIEKMLLTEKSVIAKDGTFVPVKDILYLTSKRGDVLANLAGKKPITLPGNLNAWEKLLRGLFVQTHRQYLVALDRIEGTFERFPEEPECVFWRNPATHSDLIRPPVLVESGHLF